MKAHRLSILAIQALYSLAIASPLSSESKRHEECDPQVTDPTGRTYAGFHPAPNVEAYLGIPFAQPPVGPLRWKLPQPLECADPDEKVFDASKYGKSCYQFKYASWTRDPTLDDEVVNYNIVQTEESEDCLTLNVWVPSGKKKKRLPVMVWVHGGGHAEGGTSTPGKYFYIYFFFITLLAFDKIANTMIKGMTEQIL